MPSDKIGTKSFFDPVVAREFYRERSSGLSERELELAKLFGMSAAHRIKTLYPAVKDISDVATVIGTEPLRHSPDAAQEEHLGSGVVAKGNGRTDQPDFGQQCELQGNGIDAFGQVFTGSTVHDLPPADVGASQGKARAGALEGASALPRPAAPSHSEPATWRTTMRTILAACRRLDEHWVGDLIAALCLFALGYAALLLGYVLEPLK